MNLIWVEERRIKGYLEMKVWCSGEWIESEGERMAFYGRKESKEVHKCCSMRRREKEIGR